MATPSKQTGGEKTREETNWAQPVDELHVGHDPTGAINLNVEGRKVVGPLKGFGKLWQKTYWVRLSGADVEPTQVIKNWKDNFSSFWPEGSRFFGPITGIAPGEVALINLTPAGPMSLSTGVMVIYADDESFTFMTPHGHMFSGWITFSSHEQDGASVAQVQVLIRANDPLWEIIMRAVGFKMEDAFWHRTLESLAKHFGVTGQVQMTATCVDPRLQWSQAKNIWHNAAIRTGIYTTMAPLRWVGSLVPGKK